MAEAFAISLPSRTTGTLILIVWSFPYPDKACAKDPRPILLLDPLVPLAVNDYVCGTAIFIIPVFPPPSTTTFLVVVSVLLILTLRLSVLLHAEEI